MVGERQSVSCRSMIIPLLCEGLAALISNTPGIVLVAQASSAQEGIEQFRKHQPDCDFEGFALAG